jgi:hypothetical protein
LPQNFTISVGGRNPERLKVYERRGGPETPENLAEIEQFATVDRDMFLHKRGARRRDALAVTLSLLFWAWIWGAMGLLLAVPPGDEKAGKKGAAFSSACSP